ncbi:fungal-specific transcription factor domain-containing protein [Lentinula detonsa]|uniref:Fungal-specific transcription factor domain-containing protein n=1 Tax=Lentinula detonsa TaxID=2804962 RepID=A0A9W8TT89_9AGAR|nr:fungal-specific transcription factor domain-containing protein [Lentinula detonsa]
MPGNICSNCRAFGSDCTHSMSASKRTKRKENFDQNPQAQSSQAGSDKFEFAKARIAEIMSLSAPYELPSDPVVTLEILTEISSYARSLEKELKKQSNTSVYPLYSVPNTHVEQEKYLHVEMEVSDTIKRLERLGVQESFFGKDSQLALVKAAMSVRNEYTSEGNALGSKSPEFWDVFPWQELHDPTLPPLVFPDTDLLNCLVDLYFKERNVHMPLLHQATFEDGIRNGLHKLDRDFGELVLSVCALGARYSDDLRVYAHVETKHSLGWPYFRQIVLMQDLTHSSALYRVQIIINALMFLESTSVPGICWPLLGLAVRFAQIVGAHRRNFFGPKPTVTGELWKRAVWCLVCIDTFMSSFLGRPKATNPADYDLDLLIDCDDKYWLQADDQAFQQPLGKPSTISAWRHFLKLLDIFGLAQRSLYAVRKPERWASNASWDEDIVSELNSVLNEWADTVPEHIRWDPHRQNSLFFIQSASLYSCYYWVLIQIHRPLIFVPGKGRGSGMKYSSLAVCANAARSCVHVLDRLHSRGGRHAYPSTHVSIFNSAIILLLNLWGGRKLGLATDPIRDMADVDKSLRILKVYQSKYQNAGRMCDIILELISVSKVSSPVMVEQISRVSKRPHRKDSQDNETGDRGNGSSSVAGLSSTSNSIVPTSSYRGIPYSSGIPVSSCASLVADPVPFHGMLHSNPDLDLSGGLTLYTEDLGRLPVHFMVNNYGSTGMQDQVYPSPVPHDNHQDLSTLDSTLDPQGSTGIPHGTDNESWGPETTPAHGHWRCLMTHQGGDQNIYSICR